MTERIKVCFKIMPSIRRKGRILAIENDTTLSKLIESLIEKELKEKKLKSMI